MKAAVIGAGLSGLTAAYRLQKAGWEVDCFESDSKPGGRVKTEKASGYQFDTGATGVGATYAAYLDLAKELGVNVVPGSPSFGIYRDGEVHHMRLDKMIRSGLFTRSLKPMEKLKAARIGFDLIPAIRKGYLDYADLSKSAPIDNESARDYLSDKVGEGVADYLGDPICRMMLIADSNKVSKVELFSGMANILSSLISATEGGQGAMPMKLAEIVEPQLGRRVESVVEADGKVEVDGAPYDAAVVTTPLPIAYEICPGHKDLLGPLNEGLGYTQCITVAVGTTVKPSSDAFVVGLSSRDEPNVALMFLEHTKGPGRAPEGHGLIGCCWETDASTKYMNASDEDIGNETLKAVYRVFPELRDKVDFIDVCRWDRALPWTKIGSYKKIGEFNKALDPNARVQFAADYMSAAGQHTAVGMGTQAAQNLVEAFGGGR